MTIIRKQPDISSLLGKVSFNQGQANVDRLKAEDARQLLSAMAKDSLNAGGNVKSGYFRVLTDKDGNITEIGRSSMSSKGRDKATDLIKALVAKAFGEGSAEQKLLTTYLETSGDKVGSKSLVKLIAAKSIQSETDGSASMASVSMKKEFTPDQQAAFSRYMRRIGQNVGSDTTGRLRLDEGETASLQFVTSMTTTRGAGSTSQPIRPPSIEANSVFSPTQNGEGFLGTHTSVDAYDSFDQPKSPGQITKLNANEAKQQAVRGMVDSMLHWLEVGPQTFEEDLAALQRISDWTMQHWDAENMLREANGKDRLGLEDLEDLRSKILEPVLQSEASALDPASRKKWTDKIENSPALAALRRIGGRINDELLEPINQPRQRQLEELLALTSFSITQLIRVRGALGLPALSDSQLLITEPTSANTTPEMFQNMDALFDNTGIR